MLLAEVVVVVLQQGRVLPSALDESPARVQLRRRELLARLLVVARLVHLNPGAHALAGYGETLLHEGVVCLGDSGLLLALGGDVVIPLEQQTALGVHGFLGFRLHFGLGCLGLGCLGLAGLGLWGLGCLGFRGVVEDVLGCHVRQSQNCPNGAQVSGDLLPVDDDGSRVLHGFPLSLG